MDVVAGTRLLAPVVLLRAFYLAASALILVIQAVPALNSRFLAYGSRATATAKAPSTEPAPTKTPRRPSATCAEQLLDYLASFLVPHGYFTHFYILSVGCSLFWGWLLWTPISLSGPVQLAWLLMLVQGVRRLLESQFYTAKSTSKMWVGHYILGLVFYLTINVAIWIERVHVYQGHVPRSWHRGDVRYETREEEHASLWKRTILPVAILTAHLLQHVYHAYLYRLRTQHSTYQLPSHPLFPNLICPHYTCEVAIYLIVSLLAAPPGRYVNWTLASATVFVAMNLGVTAAGTREWYMQRFGADKVDGKSRMVPWVW